MRDEAAEPELSQLGLLWEGYGDGRWREVDTRIGSSVDTGTPLLIGRAWMEGDGGRARLKSWRQREALPPLPPLPRRAQASRASVGD